MYYSRISVSVFVSAGCLDARIFFSKVEEKVFEDTKYSEELYLSTNEITFLKYFCDFSNNEV